MSDWKPVASTKDCPPGTAMEVVAAGEVIALFNVGGRFYALDGICPHQGGPLAKGELCDQIITCPWHGWQFNVTSGQHSVNQSIRHRRFEVKIEDSCVLVRIENEA